MKKDIKQLTIVGYGNVGSHLTQALVDSGIEVTHLVSRQKSSIPESLDVSIAHGVNEIPSDQLILVCVPDDAIESVIASIPASHPVAYTSGAKTINSLPQRDSLGVFYPLQTFSKGVDLNVFEVPFFIEANNEVFAAQLFDLAWKISRKVSYANSEERKRLHVAAVWVNNFTNHMNHIAYQFLEAEGLDFEHLKPLLSETVRKLEHKTPFESQTGPARRQDEQTITEHLALLGEKERELYQRITDSIKDTYKND